MKDPVAEQAIEWMVFLRSGEATGTDFDEFEHWRKSDTRHESACLKIESTLGKIQRLAQTLPEREIHRALSAPSSRRAFLQKSLCVLAATGVGSLAVNQEFPIESAFADENTLTAQRRNIVLDDGSIINMNARSAIDIDYTPQHRGISLKKGNIIASVSENTRPFVILTGFGNITTTASRVHVALFKQGVHLAVLDSAARVSTPHGQTALIKAEQGVWFNRTHITPIAISAAAETAWLQGRLEVKNATLTSVIQSLRNYTTAYIRLDPAIGDLHVSGIFPLNDVQYSLDSLAETMPIAVIRTTNYFIQIVPARI